MSILLRLGGGYAATNFSGIAPARSSSAKRANRRATFGLTFVAKRTLQLPQVQSSFESAGDFLALRLYGVFSIFCLWRWAEAYRFTSMAATENFESLGLTLKERQCLEWCKEGKTNWEIGEIMAISEKTVEFHLGNIMRKLGAANRISAVVMGIRHGCIQL